MKYAIQLLAAEFERLQQRKLELRKQGKPADMRDSEWAMTLGQVECRRLETFEALQILKKVGA